MSNFKFAQAPILEKIPEPVCQMLLEAGETRKLRAGEVIVNEGERLARLYIVLAGEVEVYLPKRSARITPVKLTRLGPGGCFGEYAFVDHQPASAAIRSVDLAEVFSISHLDLQNFLDSHMTVASIFYRNLLRILAGRLRSANAELDLFSFS
jgi:CRP-like cAMP-binding protein